MWPQYRGLEDNNVKFLHHLISNHNITHPDVTELIKILLSVAPSTSPLDHSYSKLSKISYNYRNALIKVSTLILALMEH